MTTKRSSTSNIKDVTINDVASVLHSGYFLIAGSTSVDGYPIIFSLDGITPEPDDEMLRSALIYIASLPTFSTDKNLHYCFVLDRRKSTWTAIRRLLTLLATSFSRPVKEVLLLQPTGFFQKRFSTSEASKIQTEFPSFQTVVLDDTEGLVKKLGADNVCAQLGGSAVVRIENFVQQRMSIDSLEVNCLDLEERVKELLLADAQNDFDIPNDVASTEALLNEHAEIKTNLSDEIKNIKSQGEIILQCFRDKVENLPASQQMLHIQEVQKLTTRLEDLHEAIQDYWEKEEHKLQEFMKLREFHEEFKSLQQNLNKLHEALSNVKDFVTSVKEATGSTKRLSKIEVESQSLLARSKWIAKVWSSKMASTDGLTVDTVGPKCEELMRLHDLCTESLQHKQTLASKQSTLFTHIDAARQWLADESEHPLGVEVVIDDASKASTELKHIDFQLTVGKFLEILNFGDFMTAYGSALSQETKTEVIELKTNVMELMGRYELRRSLLVEEIARLTDALKSPASGKKVMKRRKSSFAFFNKEKVPISHNEGDKSPDSVFIEKSEPDDGCQSDRKRRPSAKHSRSDGQGSLNSESSSIISAHVSEEKANTSGYGSHLTPSPVSPSSSSRGGSSYRGDDFRGKDDGSSEGAELTSETSDQFAEMTRQLNEMSAESSVEGQKSQSKTRRGSIKAIKGIFSRRKSSRAATVEDNKSENSLNVNSGVFEKSLTMEEEKLMAQARSQLMNELVTSEQKYIEDLTHIVEFYMKPIIEAGDSVPTDLYANQSLIFSNLKEIVDFNSKIFLPELADSKDSPSMIGNAFKSQVQALSKYKDYCTSRSRAEVLLRQLANDEFLAERMRLQGHNTPLSLQLLLPAKRIVQYSDFLQGMYNNLRDDLEAQRDISLVLSLLSDTTRTADDLLHQVTIDGYNDFINYLQEVDLSSHGSLLHQGRVLVAHDRKSQHTKPSDFKAKLKPRHIFLFEKVLLFCRIHEDNDKVRPYSYMHAIKLAESVLEKSGENSNKFVFRCNNESYLIQCETADQSSWYENIQFALINCETRQGELSPQRRISPVAVPTIQVNKHFMEEDDEVRLGELPDVNILDGEDLHLLDNLNKKHNSQASHEINGNSLKQYMLTDDCDNDLLIGKGDVVECVSIRKDMMQVQLPGTGIKSWMPLDLLVAYD